MKIRFGEVAFDVSVSPGGTAQLSPTDTSLGHLSALIESRINNLEMADFILDDLDLLGILSALSEREFALFPDGRHSPGALVDSVRESVNSLRIGLLAILWSLEGKIQVSMD